MRIHPSIGRHKDPFEPLISDGYPLARVMVPTFPGTGPSNQALQDAAPRWPSFRSAPSAFQTSGSAEISRRLQRLPPEGRKAHQQKPAITVHQRTRAETARADLFARKKNYRKASPETEKLWNQAFFDRLVVKDRVVIEAPYAEPYQAIYAAREGNVSDRGILVETTGFEPATPALQRRCSTD